MSKEIEHGQFVSTCRKDEKIVRHVAKNGNMSNGNIQHVEATFDMLLRHVAGVDGALDVFVPSVGRTVNYPFPFNYVVSFSHIPFLSSH